MATPEVSPSADGAPALPTLQGAGELKRALVALHWAGEEVRESLRAYLQARFGEPATTVERALARAGNPGEVLLAVDAFVLEHRLADGRRPVEVFADERSDLSAAEREMVRRWTAVVEGIFRVAASDGQSWSLENLIDGLSYRAWATASAEGHGALPADGYVACRLIPYGGGWIFSGPLSVVPALARDRVLTAAARLAVRHPQLLFRNPGLLERARQEQKAQHEAFLAFFGADEVVLPPAEAQARLDALARFLVHEHRGPDGHTRAELAATRGAPEPRPAAARLPASFARARSIGLASDAASGMAVLPNYGDFRAAVADPGAVAADGRARDTVLAYLRGAAIPPLPFRRAGDRDAAALSRALALALDRPGLDWSRDGEALLREFKPAWLDRAAYPSVFVLPPRLQAHLHGTPERNSPCPCGSGRKYKVCCGSPASPQPDAGGYGSSTT